MRTFIFLFLLMTSLAFADSDGEIESHIGEIISQRHPTDTAQTWRELGTDAPRVIISMYSRDENIYHRVRLLGALSAYDNPQATSFMKDVAESATNEALRVHSITALGESQGAKEEEFVSKFLSNPSPQTRLAAAQTLQKIGDPRALALLQDYEKNETAPWVIAKLQGNLPQPAQISKVSSSDDRLSSDFQGKWKGYWIELNSTQKKLAQSEIQFELRPEAGGSADSFKQAWGGEGAWILSAQKREQFKLSAISGKGLVLQAQISRRSAAPISTQAELSQRAGNFVLELHTQNPFGIAVLRRD